MSRAGTVRRTVRIGAPRARVWGVMGDIAGMPAWADGVRRTRLVTQKSRGVGAARLVTFADGSRVEEHFTAWRPGESYTYVATSGLPVRAYVATMSLRGRGGGTELAWESYVCADMPAGRFAGLLASLGSFYSSSLANLKKMAETKV